jgi:hypothetical protein
MLSPRTFALTFTTTACLSALAAFALADGQEFQGSTCADANCANCRQSLQEPSSSCPTNTPNRCYSSKNDSSAAVGAWCIQTGSSTPTTCNGESTGQSGPHPCGELKYWNCGCITGTQPCNLCPCAGTQTGTWTPATIGWGTCTNI